MFSWARLTQRECDEQRRRTAVHQTSTNLDIESSSDCTTDTNELNVSTFELSVSIVVNYSDRANRVAASRLIIFLFVDSHPLYLFVAGSIWEVLNAAGGHLWGSSEALFRIL